MAENQEKTEAELLEEAMQNLGLEEVVEEDKKEETLVEGAPLTDEDIESLIKDDEPGEETVVQEEIEPKITETVDETIEGKDAEDEISDVDDINLNSPSAEGIIDDTPDNSVINEEEFDVQKKQSKIVRILIIVVSILLTFVSIGVLLYFVGFFDPEPIKEVKTEVVKPPKDEYQFKQTDIDANRLNKKLNLLTKYEIVENSATEEKKAIEKENLYLEAKKQLEMERQAQIERIKEAERKRLEETLPPVQKVDINDAIDNEIEKVIEKEEPQTAAVENEMDKNTVAEEVTKTEEIVKTEEIKATEETTTQVNEEVASTPVVEEAETPQAVIETPVKEEVIVEETPKSQFVKVIKIATKSQDVYKSFLDKVYSVSDSVTLCRDYQNNIEIFVGPFDDDLSRNKIKDEYLSKYNINAEVYDYTTEEYDKRCNY